MESAGCASLAREHPDGGQRARERPGGCARGGSYSDACWSVSMRGEFQASWPGLARRETGVLPDALGPGPPREHRSANQSIDHKSLPVPVTRRRRQGGVEDRVKPGQDGRGRSIDRYRYKNQIRGSHSLGGAPEGVITGHSPSRGGRPSGRPMSRLSTRTMSYRDKHLIRDIVVW